MVFKGGFPLAFRQRLLAARLPSPLAVLLGAFGEDRLQPHGMEVVLLIFFNTSK